MKQTFFRVSAIALLIAGISGTALAGGTVAPPTSVPEIDPGMAASALALLGGALVVFRSAIRR